MKLVSLVVSITLLLFSVMCEAKSSYTTCAANSYKDKIVISCIVDGESLTAVQMVININTEEVFCYYNEDGHIVDIGCDVLQKFLPKIKDNVTKEKIKDNSTKDKKLIF